MVPGEPGAPHAASRVHPSPQERVGNKPAGQCHRGRAVDVAQVGLKSVTGQL